MPNTLEPNSTNFDKTDFLNLPQLFKQNSDSEASTPLQQVLGTYWANALHPSPTVVSISYIIENGECVVVPVPVNAVERPVLRMITNNSGVQFRRHNNC